MLQEIYDENIRDFGENKVQELCSKMEQLPSDIRLSISNIIHCFYHDFKLLFSKGKGIIFFPCQQSHKYGILQSRYFFRAIPLLVSLFFVTLPKEIKKAAI